MGTDSLYPHKNYYESVIIDTGSDLTSEGVTLLS